VEFELVVEFKLIASFHDAQKRFIFDSRGQTPNTNFLSFPLFGFQEVEWLSRSIINCGRGSIHPPGSPLHEKLHIDISLSIQTNPTVANALGAKV